MKVSYLKRNHPNFPIALVNIPSPPLQVYWVGPSTADIFSLPSVAIVGARKASAYGRHVTARLAEELAARGVLIVSGLALGIDSIAHEAALRARGKTVAVLPSGLDKIYPSSHSDLARRIVAQGGGLLSEYPDGTHPQNQNFIARNRIIAGLAEVLIVTEAAINSGSLHTARFALDQGKTVMAVPGNITSDLSQGTNNLIKAGAIPLTSTQDVLESLNLSVAPKITELEFAKSPEEHALLVLIQDGVSDGEAMLIASGLDPSQFNQTLTSLELAGRIRPLGANHWTMR